MADDEAAPGGIPAEQAAAAVKVLKNLMRQRFAAPFLKPVSEAAVPGYRAIIKQAMDLTSILQRLESNAYASLGEPSPQCADDDITVSSAPRRMEGSSEGCLAESLLRRK